MNMSYAKIIFNKKFLDYELEICEEIVDEAENRINYHLRNCLVEF